jgi:hypothetical protein
MIRLRISPDGCIRGLWTDEISFGELGTMQVRRASHVEFDEKRQCWCVRSATHAGLHARMWHWLTGNGRRTVLHRAGTRHAALAWEHDHFEPGGPGWNELVR